MNTKAVKKKLLLRRDELLGLIDAREEAATTVTLEEEEDRQFERLDDEVLAALSASDRDEVTRIQFALGKIADGTYGECEECGQEIAPARLEAMPDALVCINCASAAEA